MALRFLYGVALAGAIVFAHASAYAQTTDVAAILRNSVAANRRDFDASPHFSHKERSLKDDTLKVVAVSIIDGSPYERLLEIDGRPLTPIQQAQAMRMEAAARQERREQSSWQRNRRAAKYEQERRRDEVMIDQLTTAFDFKLVGTGVERGFGVYILSATPKAGYNPPNREAQVLTGMRGRLWIDQKTYQWVKVSAQVVEPVSISGFLATVEPGTQFLLEKAPVGDGSVWFVTHFSMKANARVLHLFDHNSSEEDTFWDFAPAK